MCTDSDCQWCHTRVIWYYCCLFKICFSFKSLLETMLSFSAVDVCVFALQPHIHNILLVWQKPYNGLSVCLPAEALIVKQHTHGRLFTLSYYPWLCRNDALERPSCLSFPWCPHCPANHCRIICFIISLTYCYSPQQVRCSNQFNANFVRLSFISCNFITYLFRWFESMMFCIPLFTTSTSVRQPPVLFLIAAHWLMIYCEKTVHIQQA